VGGLLWVWAISEVVCQVVAAAAWPRKYSWTQNTISDLGQVTCGMTSEQAGAFRWVCSPWHLEFNVGMAISGVFLAVGAVLLRGRWPRRAVGDRGLMVQTIAGVAMAGVGLAPWDRNPIAHDICSMAAVVTRWAAMIILTVAASGQLRRILRWMTAILLPLSVAGSAWFIVGMDPDRAMVLGWGLAERVAFGSLTAWTVGVGLLLLFGPPSAEVPASRAAVARGRSDSLRN
jgi:hypothetical membrane protein